MGVLDVANLFTEGPNPGCAMLDVARVLLKPAVGTSFIAIETS